MTVGSEKQTKPSCLHGIEQIRAALSAARRSGAQIGFVPTMGALHRGHLSLIETARHHGDYVVVSIFVNPTQFGPGEDFAAYPRPLDADLAACRGAGVDLVFVPSTEAMYPPGDQTRVRPGPLAEPLCGAFRPGHFEGVCTVVAKLFNVVQPDAAYFGQKDYQQALIIERMVDDLRMTVRIELCPTVREESGLAMSSRNSRLTSVERSQAVSLYEALRRGQAELLSGGRRIGQIISAMVDVVRSAGDIGLDYMSIVDPWTLAPVTQPVGRVLLAGAIRIGTTRLIDNLLVDIPT